jgi:hypothetical protein
VTDLAVDRPRWDPIRLANCLEWYGIRLTPAAVQGILRRHGLASFDRRVAELLRRAAGHGVYLSAGQVDLLLEDLAEAEALAFPPQVALAQDTLRVGVLPEIGPVYQQSAVLIGGGAVFAKLYAERSPRSAVDLLEEQVLPWCARRSLPLVAVTTDRGTEFCGYLRRHAYEGFLARHRIAHRWLGGADPQHNPFCTELHRQLLVELYRPGLHAQRYRTIYDLQQDLDLYLRLYNQRRRSPDPSSRGAAARRVA